MKLTTCLLIGLAAIAALQSWRLASEQRAHADTRTTHAEQRTDWEREARRATETARAEERRRTAEVQKAADEADQSRLVAEGHADDARAVAERLRGQLAALAARLRGATQHAPPAVAGPGVRGADALDLLTGMLARHSAELVEVGEFADRLRIAGLTCERIADSVTP